MKTNSQTMNLSSNNFDALIEKIITYRSLDRIPHIEKFNRFWLLNMLEEKNEFQLIEDHFKTHEIKGVDIIDFIKALLNLIPHEEDETLYITVGLIDLYRDICETFGLKDTVKASNILDYVVEVILSC